MHCAAAAAAQGQTGVAEAGSPTAASEESELRNLILTMVDEPLAILIKLADRLHNLRTVGTPAALE